MNNYKIAPILLIAAGLAGACGNKQQKQAAGPQAQAIPVTTDVVTEEIVAGIDAYPGSVVTLNDTDLRAEVSGYIPAIIVAAGASVSKGQNLFEKDPKR